VIPGVRAARYGTEVASALRDEIAKAKQGDPLQPVTVLVPRGVVGLAARRLLASGELGPPSASPPSLGPRSDSPPGLGSLHDSPPSGVINVQMVPPVRLAEQVVGSGFAEAGRAPINRTVLRGAVRGALGSTDDPTFGLLRDHPATVRAFVADYRDTSDLPKAALERLAGPGGTPAGAVRVLRDARARLEAWYDDGDVLDAAAAVLDAEGMPDRCRTGPVVVYLGEHFPVRAARFVQALGRRVPLVVLSGTTGDAEVDADTDDRIERLTGRRCTGRDRGPVGTPTGSAVVSAPSADTEVLIAVRNLVAHHDRGVPYDRMAVVHAGSDPYPRLIRESLALAGIACNGPGVRSMAATVGGRALSGYFDLLDHDWSRQGVMDWLAASPILDGRLEAPVTYWDHLSRRAGVGAGLEDWGQKLAAVGRPDDETPGRAAARLTGFVEGLARRVEHPPTSWSGWESWARRFLRVYLGDPDERQGWPAEEEQALVELEGLLARLGGLDTVDPRPDTARFRAALAGELEEPAPQITRFGQGVQVGTIADLVGLHVDLVVVLGLHDRAATPAAVEALFGDPERVAAGMPVRGTGAAVDERRRYLAALSAGPTRILSFARGDQRDGREQRPSRVLLDTVEALDGPTRCPSRIDDDLGPDRPGVRVVPSHVSAVAQDGRAISEEDGRLRDLLRHRATCGSLAAHPLLAGDPVLARGVASRHARAGSALTRFDGRVDPRWVRTPADGVPQSPTALETYATCPRRYFFSRVLGLRPDDRPEDAIRLRPVDKGTTVHAILERFVDEELDRTPEDRIEPGDPWHAHGGTARLERIADEELARAESAGITGKALLWRLDRATIVRELAAFLRADDGHRADGGLTPDAVEVRFGFDEPGSDTGTQPGSETATPEIALPGGRVLRFRGVIDRVDRAVDGSTVVLDYKTGSSHGADRLVGDPLDRGRRLQLAVYGLAAQARFGDVPVKSAYWFVSERGRFEQRGYDLDAGVRQRLDEVVRVLVSGIDQGLFPARPGEMTNGVFENCRFCDFQDVCAADRGLSWDRKRSDPDLAPYVRLAEDGGAPRDPGAVDAPRAGLRLLA
jgi:RecB family exonuclease